MTDWARYVLDEVIPQAVRRLGADPRRAATGGVSTGGVSTGGVSTGGDGAYHIDAPAHGPLSAPSAGTRPLWLSAGDSAAGAFDDPEDYAAC